MVEIEEGELTPTMSCAVIDPNEVWGFGCWVRGRFDNNDQWSNYDSNWTSHQLSFEAYKEQCRRRILQFAKGDKLIQVRFTKVRLL